MAAVKKTNAARVLDKLGIPYALNTYPVDIDDLSATHVAESMGVDPSCVFKTLVTRGHPNGIAMAVVPGNAELSLKKLAAVFHDKNVEMVPLKEVLPLTGYIRGGCSPVGTKKPYPVCIDESARNFEKIYVSAGQRGLQFFIAPEDLARAVNAVFADIVMG
ncbi:Cys-tRNA(Pro) deacylase [uncultured Mailhella sp.]|uniref:Cys-tRNA(Pro) deacylase n=1 Tax=uncultured Mailhella sp. TaxID=1981031 RepID=UPI0025FA65CF|nr:Cys-tRNA(Pro) deacylase [uncultured Mailhella sp.]